MVSLTLHYHGKEGEARKTREGGRNDLSLKTLRNVKQPVKAKLFVLYTQLRIADIKLCLRIDVIF